MTTWHVKIHMCKPWCLHTAVGVFHVVLAGLTVSCVMMSRGRSAGVRTDIYGLYLFINTTYPAYKPACRSPPLNVCVCSYGG